MSRSPALSSSSRQPGGLSHCLSRVWSSCNSTVLAIRSGTGAERNRCRAITAHKAVRPPKTRLQRIRCIIGLNSPAVPAAQRSSVPSRGRTALADVRWRALGSPVAWLQSSDAPVSECLLQTRSHASCQGGAPGVQQGDDQRLPGCHKAPREFAQIASKIPSHRHPPAMAVKKRAPGPLLPGKQEKKVQLCHVFTVYYTSMESCS